MECHTKKWIDTWTRLDIFPKGSFLERKMDMLSDQRTTKTERWFVAQDKRWSTFFEAAAPS